MDEINKTLILAGKSITLINKILGPGLTIRQANADSRAALQGVITEQIVSRLEQSPNDPDLLEAIASCSGKTNFKNIVRIAQLATSQLTDNARPELISDDWGANFKDKACTCSDPEMATLWAQLLAGEANNPGSYSRKTVNILADMEPEDARSFSALCRFQIMVHSNNIDRLPLVLDTDTDFYVRHGVARSSLLALHDLQLIHLATVRPGAIGLGATAGCTYFALSDGFIGLVSDDGQNKNCEISLGNVSFTKTGSEMSNLCLPLETPPGFVDFLISKWDEEERLRGFSVERWSLSVDFADRKLQARPDLGKILDLGPR